MENPLKCLDDNYDLSSIRNQGFLSQSDKKVTTVNIGPGLILFVLLLVLARLALEYPGKMI